MEDFKTEGEKVRAHFAESMAVHQVILHPQMPDGFPMFGIAEHFPLGPFAIDLGQIDSATESLDRRSQGNLRHSPTTHDRGCPDLIAVAGFFQKNGSFRDCDGLAENPGPHSCRILLEDRKNAWVRFVTVYGCVGKRLTAASAKNPWFAPMSKIVEGVSFNASNP
jgi:hypothetical protein